MWSKFHLSQKTKETTMTRAQGMTIIFVGRLGDGPLPLDLLMSRGKAPGRSHGQVVSRGQILPPPSLRSQKHVQNWLLLSVLSSPFHSFRRKLRELFSNNLLFQSLRVTCYVMLSIELKSSCEYERIGMHACAYQPMRYRLHCCSAVHGQRKLCENVSIQTF